MKPRLAQAGMATFAVLAVLTLVLPAASAVRFDDHALQQGIDFRRAGDPYDPDPNFVEMMGGGACWLDADGDGELDLFLVSGWYNASTLAQDQRPGSRLFHNLGSGSGFEDATASSRLDVQGWTQGCSAADFDGDGWTDLFVQGYGIQSLFRNNGDGTFTNVTAASGITADGKCPGNPCWGTSSAWMDLDHDGCLDLYVANFVSFDVGQGGFRGPGTYDGQPSQLYRNDCDGTFTDISAPSGADGQPSRHHGKFWSVAWLDYDHDGWPDLYLTSDGEPNVLYRNNGNGTFTDTASQAGVADTRNGMGLAIGDCNDDGFEDLYFTHYAAVQQVAYIGYDGFYLNRGNRTFADHSGEGDLSVVLPYVKWGVQWSDFDNDGALDLYITTGHTEPWASVPDPDQPPVFLTGDTSCRYTDARSTAGSAMDVKRMGRGSSSADYDHDGLLDIVQVNLLRERTELLHASGAAGNWLTLQLRQPGMNRLGLGAELTITTPDGHVQHRRLNPSQSIHGSNAPEVHVGLGTFSSANVTVRWPEDAFATTYTGLAANQVLRLDRDGRVQADTLAPRTTILVDGQPATDAWHRAPVQLAFAAQDKGVTQVSGVARTDGTIDGADFTGAGPLTLGEGAHAVTARSVDIAGNQEPLRRVAVGVDSQAPTASLSLAGTLLDGWYRGPVDATLACADATSGVALRQWRLDEGPWQATSGAFRVARAGQHVLTWACEDAAGNRATGAADLALDLGAPQTVPSLQGTSGAAGWWTSDVTVALDANGGLRNVTAVHVAVDDGPAFAYAGPFVLSGDGVHALRVWAEDDGGRTEEAQDEPVRIDATPPALSLTNDGLSASWPDRFVVGVHNRLLAAGSDATSGPVEVQMKVDDDVWERARPTTLGQPGAHRVLVRGTDAAGNVALLERRVDLDRTPPTLDVLRPAPQSVNVGSIGVPLPQPLFAFRAVVAGPVPFEVATSDVDAGVARVEFRVDGMLQAVVTQAPWVWNWSLLPDPTHPLRFVSIDAFDGVGNRNGTIFGVLAVGTVPGLASPAHGPEGLGAGPPLLAVAGIALLRRRPPPGGPGAAGKLFPRTGR